MNGYASALLALVVFHGIVTADGLLFDQIPQALGQGAKDNDSQLVGVVLGRCGVRRYRRARLAWRT